MEYKNLTFETTDGVGVLTVDRPKVLNAMNLELIGELECLIYDIETKEEVRALVITGAGEKAFVAGADINMLKDLDPVGAAALSRRGHGLTLRIESLGVPVIAAVNGFALGGGLELALACDFIYASENAQFGLPEVSLGIAPGFGGTQRLARRVGAARALEMCLTGDFIGAEEALRVGLANLVVPLKELIPTTLKRARKMAALGRVAKAAIKRLVRLAGDVDLSSGLRAEAEAFGLVFSHPDAKEGLCAFMEKRKPRFE